jgi:hypothetical protein
LLKQEDFAVHREERGKFRRRRVVAPFVDYQWDIDTAHMGFFAKNNDVYKYFTLTVDIMSKYVWTVALKTTTAAETVQAFTHIFQAGRKPTRIRSDAGSEFVNGKFKAF